MCVTQMYNRIFNNKIAKLSINHYNILNKYTSIITCNYAYILNISNIRGTSNNALSIDTDLYGNDGDENIEDINNLKAILSIPNDPKQLYKSEDARKDLANATKLVSTIEQVTKHDMSHIQTIDNATKFIPQRLVKELSTLISNDPPDKSADFEYLIDYLIPYHDVYTLSQRLAEILLMRIELAERKGKNSLTIKSDIIPSPLHCNKLLSSSIVLSSSYACLSILVWISNRDSKSIIDMNQPHSLPRAVSRTCKLGFQLIQMMFKYEIPFDPIIPTFLLWNSKSHPDGPGLVNLLSSIENPSIFPISSVLSNQSSLSTDAYNAVLLDMLKRKDTSLFEQIYQKIANPNEMTLSLYHDYTVKIQKKEQSIDLAISLIQTESIHKYPSILLKILLRYSLVRDFDTMAMLLDKIFLHIPKEKLSPTFELDVIYSLASLFDCKMNDFQNVLNKLVLSKPEIRNTTEYLLLLYKNAKQELFSIIFHNDLDSFPLYVLHFLVLLVTNTPICYDDSGSFTRKIFIRLDARLKTINREKKCSELSMFESLKTFPTLVDLMALAGSRFSTPNTITTQVIESLQRFLVEKKEYLVLEKLVKYYHDQGRLNEILSSAASVRSVLYALIYRKAWDYVLIVLNTLSEMNIMAKDEAIQDQLLNSLIVHHRPALYYYAGTLLHHCISARIHVRKWLKERFLAKDSATIKDLVSYMKNTPKISDIESKLCKFEKLMEKENIECIEELRAWLDHNIPKDKEMSNEFNLIPLDMHFFVELYSILDVPLFVKI